MQERIELSSGTRLSEDGPDEIYMFGFSRGAFTIRTLTGLIQHEGLLPASFVKNGEKENVSRAEMRRIRLHEQLADRAPTRGRPWL